MRDDELIDRLLRDAMAADVPQLPPAFDAEVMERLRPRRLTMMGRVVIAAYTLVAAATAGWLMRDLRIDLIASAVAIGVPVAVGASAYVRRLVVSH